MVVLFSVSLNIAIFRALCIHRCGVAVQPSPALDSGCTFYHSLQQEHEAWVQWLSTIKSCIVFLYCDRRWLETVILKSKWPHFSKEGIGNNTYGLPEHPLDFTAEHFNVHPAKWFILSYHSSKSKVQLCSEVEKCPFLLPKASIFPWEPKALTVFHPLAKFTASSHSFCEQTVFSVWQTGAFWRQKTLGTYPGKMHHLVHSAYSKLFFFLFCLKLATEYMGPWL